MCTFHSCPSCAAARRHKRHAATRRTQRGILRATSPEVRRRLLDEGVPSGDVSVVAVELERCIRLVGEGGDDIAAIRLSPWAYTILSRYRDKTRVIFMSVRGGGLAR